MPHDHHDREPRPDPSMSRQVPYGEWPSRLSAARATRGAMRLGQIVVDDGAVYWLEGRPSEGGRHVLVRLSPDGVRQDVSPPEINVRTRVHEYGGAAYTVHRGTIYASNFADQRLYAWRPGTPPQPLTSPGGFYAQCQVDPRRSRLIGVREDHTGGDTEPRASIVAVDLDADGPTSGTVLVSGADFYADAMLSPDGTHLSWIEWGHPDMPWDGTELYVTVLDSQGRPGTRVRVAGGRDESIVQPRWSPDGMLYFLSDRTGWWNLYRWTDGRAGPLLPMAADFGKPLWTFGTTTYGFQSATRLIVSWAEGGRWRLGRLSVDMAALEPIDLPVDPLDALVVTSESVYFIGGSPVDGPAVVRVTLEPTRLEVLQRGSDDALDPRDVSVPEPITFDSDGRPTYAFYYPPTSSDVVAPPGALPPLLVLSHGGPTAATEPIYDPKIQFWTTRGFAVADVNYGGSSGFGRAYRQRLNWQWGLVDVADAVNAARHLVAAGKADPARLITRGGSAGGYTTLAALTFHDTFTAGASYYGISDLETLATDTHKFESRYLESLVGPYPAAQAIYRDRSPIHFVDRLDCALILLQGLDDRVVPPSQSARMADAVRAKGLPVAYITFEGEQHGFRRAESIVRALESELYFYGRVFGFTPADALPEIAIDNL